jgi:uncharacterized DUF497 family protein
MWRNAKILSMHVPVLNGTKQTRTRTGSGIELAPEEAEGVSFNEPLVVRSDIRHSRREKKYYAFGQTDGGRCLFTIRRSLVRIISVRDMNRRERDAYAKQEDEAGA